MLPSFYKNILIMFRGTLFAQVIAVFGTVILAKVYGEEAYGIFGVFMSIISIISIISTLQLDKCIVLSKDENESINWFNFLLVLTPALSILILALVSIISNYFFSTKLNLDLIILASVGTLLFTFNSINESFFTFKKEFITISNSKIFLTISNISAQFLLFYYFSLFGLIIGFLISQSLLLLFYFFKNSTIISKTNFKEIKKGIQKNTPIVKYLLPSTALNSLANNLMPILILTFFGAKEAGVYFFSIKILGTPLFLISSSISQVFFQKSSKLLKENKTELLRLTKKIVTTNLIVMLGFLILLNTLGMYLLEYFFDEKWNNLRPYTFLLSILVFARTAFNPISSLIVVLNKNSVGLIFNSYLFIVNLIAIYFGYLHSEITITIFILAIFGGIGYFLLLAYFLNHLKYISKNNV